MLLFKVSRCVVRIKILPALFATDFVIQRITPSVTIVYVWNLRRSSILTIYIGEISSLFAYP